MNIMNLYVYENRSMSNDLSKPIMLENLNVDNVQIHIPKEIDGTDMGTWAWWFVYQNAKHEKYSIPMTIEGVTNDEGEEEYISTVGLNHGFTGKHGSAMYAIEAVQADGSGSVTHEWHTRTYKLEIVTTLQGNQTEYSETESDIISALISRVNELIQSGAEIAEIAETIEHAAETAQEVIDSIPADYSEMSNRVGANTIALAEKADRATTYTKTEVDQMIEDVEVETDTTLEVAGAAADAAETGRQIGLLNESLGAYASLSTSKRTAIPDNTDLNDLITPGQYKITTLARTRTLENIPVASAGTLDVWTNTSNSTCTQLYIPNTTGYSPHVYIRNRTSGGVWTSWVYGVNSRDWECVSKILNREYIAIEQNTDLNNIVTPGTYKATSASVATTLSNSPFDIGFNLRVFNVTDANTVYQAAFVASDAASVKVRFINPSNDTYGEWKTVSANIDGDALLTAIGAVGNTASSNTSRILALESAAGISGGYITPYTTQEQAFYDKVNNDIDKNTLVFLISADNHYRETKPEGEHQVEFAEVMAKMAKRLRCDAIINLGDIITQYIDSIDDEIYADTDVTAEEVNTMRLAKMATAFQSTGVPFLYTLAHHERYLHTNSPTSTDNTTQTSVYPYPESKVLGLCGKGAEWIEEHHYSQDPLSAGYYVDFYRHKIRLIFIDSVSYSATGFTQSSIAFITEAFSNVPTGYKVIVCTHVATREPGVYSATINNWQQVETIMGNFVSNGGTILAVLHGHAHYDNVVFIENVPYPYICICCAENSWSTVGEKIEAGVQGNPVSYKYHAARYGAIGTYNEYLFDIMCVHPDTNTLKFFRFGIGEDRTVTLATS